MPSDRQKQMASLYVLGPPEVRGDWGAAARKAGFRRVPNRDSATMRALVGELGGVVAEFGEPSAQTEVEELLVSEDDSEDDAEVQAEIEKALESVAAPSDEEGWKKAADALWPTWRSIAAGHVDASPRQAIALRDIMDRGRGKAGRQVGGPEVAEIGVVVLPALGTGAGLTVCPNCGDKLDES